MFQRVLLLLPLAASLFATPPASAQDLPITLAARSIAIVDSLTDGATIGGIRVRGMLELPTVDLGDVRFSQLSALAWDNDEEILYALSDKGWLFHLQPEFTNGNLTGVRLSKAFALTDPKSGKRLRSWLGDAEGMDILNGRNGRKGDTELLISFEHTPRILRYRPDGSASGQLTLPPELADAKAYRNPNKMLEAVCADASFGVLTTPEEPLEDEPEGTTRIFSLTGKSWRYPLTGSFRITALECLGEGRLLVLERNFGLTRNATSLKMTTLPATTTTQALGLTTVADLNANDGHQIDNFEGLTRYKGNTFFMVSDDNDLFVQRTLLLFFELVPSPATRR